MGLDLVMGRGRGGMMRRVTGGRGCCGCCGYWEGRREKRKKIRRWLNDMALSWGEEKKAMGRTSIGLI
jgi:hypothetical protein